MSASGLPARERAPDAGGRGCHRRPV